MEYAGTGRARIDFLLIEAGVPQGSKLSSLSLTINVYDLASTVPICLYHYADGAVLIAIAAVTRAMNYSAHTIASILTLPRFNLSAFTARRKRSTLIIVFCCMAPIVLTVIVNL